MLLPHYPPDVAADGQLFSLLARELVRRGVRIRVLTWRPRYQGRIDRAPRREVIDGVDIRRMWAPRGSKALAGRALAALWVVKTGFLRALFSRGTLLMPSSPPPLGLVGWWLSWLGRRYIYVLHDIHPELGIALNRMSPGPVAGLLRFFQRLSLARWRTVTLTEGMKKHALSIQPGARITVVPNWVDGDAIKPKPKAESEFARANDLIESFVVQYSGNLGLLHPLEELTQAVKSLPDIVLTYIGRGAKLAATKQLAEGAANIRFFDYQPFGRLDDSLAACDLAVVAIEPGADKLAMPSKLQGVLAAGRPILVLGPPDSELTQIVTEGDCGVVVGDFDNPDVIAERIQQLRSDPGRLNEMGVNARKLAVERYSVAKAADAYLALLT